MTRTDPGLSGPLLDDRYRVERLLAQGGMSAVYRGTDTRLDRPVAIKVMDPRFADDRSFVERFEREARAAAGLHHPNIVAVHDQGVDADRGDGQRRTFLIMELVEGATLRQLLDAHGALDMHVALSVLEPVLSALAAAHQAGLVHRDVKPENVLIGHGNTAGAEPIKVADFGLARAVAGGNATSSSVILGTVAYLSPEQVTDGSASQRGDVYSAGILLYEMLTGTQPYSGDTALSVAYRHVNDDVPAPSTARPGIPPALDELVLRATRRDPDARPADAATFLNELRQVRDQLGMEVVPVPVPGPSAAETAHHTPPPEHGAHADSERTVPTMHAVTTEVHAPTHAGPSGTTAMRREEPTRAPAAAQTFSARASAARRWLSTRARSRRWIALVSVAALLLVGGIGGVWWLNARWVPVPDVAGMTKAAATQDIRGAELTIEFATERHNTVADGTVIRTTPSGGSQALPGDPVTLVVSTGKPVVPDIDSGTPANAAERMIREEQLVPERKQSANRYSTSVQQGRVITVRPKPGSRANIDDPVTLVLSKGPPPTPVPDVTGKPKKKAFDLLREEGFEPYVAEKRFSKKAQDGHVFKTDPSAGTRGGTDTSMRVGVYVSTAVEVPLLIGKPIDKAAEILRDAKLKPKFDGSLHNGDEGNSDRFGFVVNQNPDAGSMVKRKSTVKMKTVP